MTDRYCLIATDTEDLHAAFARDVRYGLAQSPKRLPCRYFYDQEGSALFEAICDLPEYYLTRAEEAILDQVAGEIGGRFPAPVTMVELGSGSARKTRTLLEAFLRSHGTLRYVPIDISRSMLEESSRALIADYPTLQVVAVAAEYHEGLKQIQPHSWSPKLILWLGSNIGNFERSEATRFLQKIRDTMGPQDRLLVGIDLRKDRRVLEAAYDDSQGVTARFNRNVLARINRELGGRFELDKFTHQAVYNEEAGRVEMYLVSTCAQVVPIQHLSLEVHFEAGEAIHTENSCKYSLDEIRSLADVAGFEPEAQWLDDERRFSLNLFACLAARKS